MPFFITYQFITGAGHHMVLKAAEAISLLNDLTRAGAEKIEIRDDTGTLVTLAELTALIRKSLQ